jgi:cysteine synthase B
MIGIVKGYKVKVVMPDNVSQERTRLLQAFGADIVYSEGAHGTNGAIQMALRMVEEDGRYYMPFQFGNENNPRAHYETTGPEILRDLPDLDVFVAGLGTGGTLTGVGRCFKEHNPSIKVIATLPPVGDLAEGIFAGISSGAVLHTAQRVAKQMKQGKIVALLADGGWKYLSMPLDHGL